jgi:hypothetical protein
MQGLKTAGIFLAVCEALWWIIASIPFFGFIVYLIFGFRTGKKMTM